MDLTEDHATVLADAATSALRPSPGRGDCWLSTLPPATLRHDRQTVARLLAAGYLRIGRQQLARITAEGLSALRAYEHTRRARQFAGQRTEAA